MQPPDFWTVECILRMFIDYATDTQPYTQIARACFRRAIWSRRLLTSRMTHITHTTCPARHTVNHSQARFVEPADAMVLEQPDREHRQCQQECVQQQIQRIDAMHEIRLGIQFDVGGLGIAEQLLAQSVGAQQQNAEQQKRRWSFAPECRHRVHTNGNSLVPDVGNIVRFYSEYFSASWSVWVWVCTCVDKTHLFGGFSSPQLRRTLGEIENVVYLRRFWGLMFIS